MGNSELLFGLLTALFSSGTVVFILRWIKEYKRRKLRGRYRDGVRAIAHVFGFLQEILNRTQFSRVMILKVENCGGVPGPGREVFSTLVHEVRDSTLPSVRDSWIHQPLDGEYCDMILRLIEKKKDAIRTSDLKQESMIRNLYVSQNIKFSEVHLLCMTEKAIYYLSMVSIKDNILSEGHHYLIESAINRLRSIFEEWHEVIDK